MIATVKIAPVERWCEPNLRDLENWPIGAELVGMEVEILPARMEIHAQGCDGRCWPLSDKSFREVAQIVGDKHYDSDLWLCEHMLEMD